MATGKINHSNCSVLVLIFQLLNSARIAIVSINKIAVKVDLLVLFKYLNDKTGLQCKYPLWTGLGPNTKIKHQEHRWRKRPPSILHQMLSDPPANHRV